MTRLKPSTIGNVAALSNEMTVNATSCSNSPIPVDIRD